MRDFLGVGAGPIKLGSPRGAGLACFPIETFETPTLDLTASILGVELIPARPGYFPMSLVIQWLILSAAGTQTVPASAQIGSDAARTNFAPSTAAPTNANVNAANPPCNFVTGLQVSANTARRIPGATIFLDVTSGAQGTGGFSLRAKYQVAVVWIAAG